MWHGVVLPKLVPHTRPLPEPRICTPSGRTSRSIPPPLPPIRQSGPSSRGQRPPSPGTIKVPVRPGVSTILLLSEAIAETVGLRNSGEWDGTGREARDEAHPVSFLKSINPRTSSRGRMLSDVFLSSSSSREGCRELPPSTFLHQNMWWLLTSWMPQTPRPITAF
ncbi:hypothetical protein CTAM01_10604 [Colletotrichum tamarilloi]|uniref:Uncharacterized protein n=1 Tax=Colletotrichum tamarilloi TaxID=1209934 RepID=A0ABQ9QZW6_9PEZI|nr:uncharacterized protein CTAM01_10604 [Colletotrichum tamarilloi]KAK1490678.1 hypothetical protein CTAM01_10604 [Colletotrichum tamarilloi]